MTVLTLIENLDDTNPASVTAFSPSLSKSSMSWYATPATYTQQDIEDTVNFLIGTCKYKLSSQGNLVRTLPAVHPQYPWLSCEAVPSVKGLGADSNPATNAITPLITPLPPQLPKFYKYPCLKFDTQFTQLPYTPKPDSTIIKTEGNWYNPSGSSQTFSYNNEWSRYTKFTPVSVDKSVTADYGQSFFRSTGGAPDGTLFPGKLKKFLPDQILTVTWFYVPQRYLTSPTSYLLKYKGYINQCVDPSNTTFGLYNPGQLLYAGCSASEAYTPPFPTVETIFGTSQYAKFVDLKLTFLLTNRTATTAPTPSNNNFIVNGWNAQPWFKTSKYYYVTVRATAGTDATSDLPYFLSVPMEILFFDPDVSNINI